MTGTAEYRKLTVGNYLMLYWVEEDQKLVTVARVMYGKRDWPMQLE